MTPLYTMDHPKFFVTKQKEESTSTQRVNSAKKLHETSKHFWLAPSSEFQDFRMFRINNDQYLLLELSFKALM